MFGAMDLTNSDSTQSSSSKIFLMNRRNSFAKVILFVRTYMVIVFRLYVINDHTPHVLLNKSQMNAITNVNSIPLDPSALFSGGFQTYIPPWMAGTESDSSSPLHFPVSNDGFVRDRLNRSDYFNSIFLTILLLSAAGRTIYWTIFRETQTSCCP